MGRSVDKEEKDTMTKEVCPICGGELKKELVSYDEPWGTKIYRFEDVPALVCSDCGEIFLAAEVSQEIERIIAAHEQPDRYEEIPVSCFEVTRFSKDNHKPSCLRSLPQLFSRDPLVEGFHRVLRYDAFTNEVSSSIDIFMH